MSVALGALWPRRAFSQQLPVVGYLSALSEGPSKYLVAAFADGLRRRGFVVGKNVIVDYRWAENDYARLPELAEDLVRRKVAVIAATGGLPAPIAAKRAS